MHYAGICLLALSLLAASVLAAEGTPTARPVTIWSDGTRLAGDLWKPPGLAPGSKVPAILLVHGWGGVKAHLNQAYAPVFAREGVIVLTFDYRGWGESDGKFVRTGARPEAGDDGEMTLPVREVREIVDPIDQLADIESALAFLAGEPGVDTDRLAIWGSSLGGGLALQIAGQHPEIKVLITQIGAVNSLANFETGNADFKALAWQNLISRARGDAPPFPTETQPGLSGAPDYFAMSRYDPIAWADNLEAATLIIDASDEELFDTRVNGAELYARIRDRVPASYRQLPGRHYDLYRDDGYRQAVALELEWLRRYLLAENPPSAWQSLFNGKDLTGWIPKIRGEAPGEDARHTFRVEDGLLTVSYRDYEDFGDRFGHLHYAVPYSHYRLRLEYRFVGDQPPGGPDWAFRNSGVMIHGQDPTTMNPEQDFPISVEAQLLGGRGDGKPRPTGNVCTPGTHIVYHGLRTETHCIPADGPTIDDDRWVRFEILVVGGERVVHYVDGRPVIEYGGLTTGGGVVSGYREDLKPEGAPLTSGFISLQSESHPVQFRSIELKDLAED